MSDFWEFQKKDISYRFIAMLIIFTIWTVVVFYYHFAGSMGETDGIPSWIIDGLALSFFLTFIQLIWLIILVSIVILIGYLVLYGIYEIAIKYIPIIARSYAFSLPMIILYIVFIGGLIALVLYRNWMYDKKWQEEAKEKSRNYEKERERRQREQRENEDNTGSEKEKNHGYGYSESWNEKENRALGMDIGSLKQEINRWQREFVKATDRNDKKKMEEANEKIRHLTELYKTMKEAKNKRDKG